MSKITLIFITLTLTTLTSTTTIAATNVCEERAQARLEKTEADALKFYNKAIPQPNTGWLKTCLDKIDAGIDGLFAGSMPNFNDVLQRLLDGVCNAITDTIESRIDELKSGVSTSYGGAGFEVEILPRSNYKIKDTSRQVADDIWKTVVKKR